MAELKSYFINFQGDGATISGGAVLAQDDQHAMIEVGKAVRKFAEDYTTGLPLDFRVLVTKPDGSELCAPATVAEFLEKK